MVLGPRPGAYIIVLSTNGFGMVTNLDSRWAGQVAVARQKWGWRKLAGLVMGIVFTGDSGESNPRLWSDETSGSNPNRGASIGRKNIDHSVTNRRVEHFSRAHSQKHWGFERFLSACFLKTPRPLLRFYYARQRVVAN